jgi:hypothetical protein
MITRYAMSWGKDEDGSIYVSPTEQPKGNWVKWEDYSKLQAEVERLDTLCKQLMAQHSDISCENIMLRKAGDAMASSIQFNEEMAQDYNGPTIVHKSVQRWNAAKEGNMTK